MSCMSLRELFIQIKWIDFLQRYVARRHIRRSRAILCRDVMVCNKHLVAEAAHVSGLIHAAVQKHKVLSADYAQGSITSGL